MLFDAKCAYTQWQYRRELCKIAGCKQQNKKRKVKQIIPENTAPTKIKAITYNKSKDLSPAVTLPL